MDRAYAYCPDYAGRKKRQTRVLLCRYGWPAKINRSAEAEGLDLSPYEAVYTEHSHEAAAHAVKLARKKEGWTA